MTITAQHWKMSYTPVPGSIRLVRRHVRRTLSEWGCGEEQIADPLLVVDELSVNAIQHGRVPGRFFEVSIILDGDACLIEVSDPGDGRPALREPADDDERGRGLWLVGALSESWTVYGRPHGIGKTVQAVVRLRV